MPASHRFFCFIRHRLRSPGTAMYALLLVCVQLITFADSTTAGVASPTTDMVEEERLADLVDRQVRITNGVRTSVGQYPSLTCLLYTSPSPRDS